MKKLVCLQPSRREFLVQSGAVIAAAITRTLSSVAVADDRFVLKSQPLPSPRIILPTDRLPPP